MFHPLRVAEVRPLTDDSVTISFEVPEELRAAYRYRPGQHIAIRRQVAGAEVRRTYSLCDPVPADLLPAGPEAVPGSGPGDGPDSGPRRLRVGVRLVEDGEFSTYALKELLTGHVLDVMTPAGRFVLEPRPGRFAAVVGGSGITPVLSQIGTVLAREPRATFCLIRSDRTAASTMFLEEVADLKDRWPDRFHLVSALSREEQQAGLPSGRLDAERLTALLPALLPVLAVDGWYLCGPLGLVSAAEHALRTLGVPRSRVHQEIFHVDEVAAEAPAGPTAAAGPMSGGATVRATLDGRGGSWPSAGEESVLETVLRNRSDAPYACKGGVCGTCRAKLVSGEVRMDRNFALEPEETEAGYVLACQSHPLTPVVEVDFDA
ncbi:ring-1,2-phenylacetyl-CoA epoxidase subunit PaaE [Streptomyces sp. DvalAA-14]|uniref:2Fe-2S iron-sulfur cluster-binding protein n=1 Tax=unclassified Streptomyces TaxID=2593676 RepID=UPI00081B3B94|nr:MULTISPECIES: 2Fe-2S iron-sulfur cluster-binding protein [unclassified Streptomyces]MYS18793.1 2Fe-2S iron-sulfur cluster binding domain-containing protein [Streptomyces sp. SID4948]SCD29501.1 ring-1,2-phenylacetyl-CoA epoxidase subunit PaaE [Streptomyces sp. DvalAA-14]